MALVLMNDINDQLMFWLQIGCWANPLHLTSLAVTSPLISKLLPEASVRAGSAFFYAEECKHESNDAKCAELGWVSIPLAVETYGCWGTEARWAFSQVASLIDHKTEVP